MFSRDDSGKPLKGAFRKSFQFPNRLFDRDTLFLTAYDATDGTLYDSLFVVKTATSTLLCDYGEDIPERLDFTPSPESSKDAAFAERIREYQEKKKKE